MLWFCAGSEFDPTQPPRLNERVLKDKRKKLRETFDRVINMYVSMSVGLSVPVICFSDLGFIRCSFIIRLLCRRLEAEQWNTLCFCLLDYSKKF